MCACQKFSKFVVFTVNVIMLISSIVFISYVLSKSKKEKWVDLVKNNVPFKIAIFIFGIILLTIVFGFLTPCCSKAICYSYLILLFILIIFEIVAIALSYKYRTKFLDEIDSNWYHDDLRGAVNAFENSFECCGFRNYTGSYVCGYNYTAFNISVENVSTCYDQLRTKISSNLSYISAFGFGFEVAQIVLFICALCIACA